MNAFSDPCYRQNPAVHFRSVSMMTSDQFSSSNRMHIQNPLEKPVKSGWLKKQQKTFVKNWQQKFFKLHGQHLCYYKDEDDSKQQGCLFLPMSRVSEVSCSPDDAGKYIFEITPGSSIDQLNKPIPDPYVLMASSQAEMEEWVKAISRAAGTISGVVFGQRLVDTIAYEKKYGRHTVPILMEKCADFICEKGLNEEGIFRLPGQDNLVKQLKEAFDAGERPSFSKDTDVHTVASLFKLYLRELPEPVVPWSQYDDFLSCEEKINNDKDQGQEELKKHILLLPKENYNLLCFICRFLFEVQKHSSINKMSVDNLAMVIGVNLLRPKIEEPVALMRSAPQIQKLMTVMISQHEEFFPKDNDLPVEPTRKKSDHKKMQLPRSSVGWDTAEENLLSGEDTTVEGDFRGISISDNVLQEEELFSRDRPGSMKAVPRKRTQTLPNANFFVSGKKGSNKVDNHTGQVDRGEYCTSSAYSRQAFTAVSSLRHKRTLSEDFKCHRKSTYDNVPCLQSDIENSSRSSPANVFAIPVGEQPGQQSPNSPKHRMDITEGCSNCVILQREIHVQREQLNDQIQSLQKENYEVWKKVVKLNNELEKERNKRMAVEVALQNAERSCKDAEKKSGSEKD
ncbi:rho GTPase-activating protein 25 [Spea bombifrons]|uniref:rho GTPase-activating protein 25 n=1 Tax=Spea bombifrons TaxID=233779 RepID=UPI00234A8C0A|nr:rho GTPase-activating protein 25 [Spea bombifrons]